MLPVGSHVLRHVEFFVDLARRVDELGAVCPRRSEPPGALGWMELPFINLFPGVKTSHVNSAILSNPVDAMCSYKENLEDISGLPIKTTTLSSTGLWSMEDTAPI